MTTEQVENEALKLKPQERAELAEKLLRSLEDLSEEEIERLWVKEAIRRDAELDSGSASMRDAEDVFRDARANYYSGRSGGGATATKSSTKRWPY